LRPDLRDFNKQELEESLDFSKPEDKAEFQKQNYANLNWMEGVEDQVAERFTSLMNNASHKLPRGGIRIGLVDSFLKALKTPQQLRVAIQCLTVWQHRSKRDKAELTNTAIPLTTSSLVIDASIRVNAPDIGLSYIQMPWIDTTITLNMVNKILDKYATDAEERVLFRKLEGKAPLIPQTFRETEKTNEKKDETDDEEESEEEVTEGELDEKKIQKLYTQWVDGFMAAYKEARSQKHTWKADKKTYSSVARFYSSFGDIDAALEITKAFPESLSRAASTITLALIQAGRLEEAETIANSHWLTPRAKKALAVAQGKEEPETATEQQAE